MRFDDCPHGCVKAGSFDRLVHYFDNFAGNPQTKTKATGAVYVGPTGLRFNFSTQTEQHMKTAQRSVLKTIATWLPVHGGLPDPCLSVHTSVFPELRH